MALSLSLSLLSLSLSLSPSLSTCLSNKAIRVGLLLHKLLHGFFPEVQRIRRDAVLSPTPPAHYAGVTGVEGDDTAPVLVAAGAAGAVEGAAGAAAVLPEVEPAPVGILFRVLEAALAVVVGAKTRSGKRPYDHRYGQHGIIAGRLNLLLVLLRRGQGRRRRGRGVLCLDGLDLNAHALLHSRREAVGPVEVRKRLRHCLGERRGLVEGCIAQESPCPQHHLPGVIVPLLEETAAAAAAVAVAPAAAALAGVGVGGPGVDFLARGVANGDGECREVVLFYPQVANG